MTANLMRDHFGNFMIAEKRARETHRARMTVKHLCDYFTILLFCD